MRMGMFRGLMVMLAAAMLPACAAVAPMLGTIGTVSDAISSRGNTVLLGGTKGLLMAHNAYQGAAAIATVAVKSGRLSGNQLNSLDRLNDQALAILVGARSARDQAKAAAELFTIVDRINDLVGGPKVGDVRLPVDARSGERLAIALKAAGAG